MLDISAQRVPERIVDSELVLGLQEDIMMMDDPT